jgi:hypothetical protein
VDLTPHQEAIADYTVQNLGPIQGMFDLAPPGPESLPMKLLYVPATEHKPFQLLVSAGMSAQAMAIPEDFEGDPPPDRVELLIGLPPDWPVEQARGEHVWPLRLLAHLARLPSEATGWLCEGHTIPNGDPAHPYAPSTELSCALIAPPLVIPPEARTIPLPEGAAAQLLAVVPLFEREVEAKLKEGVDKLFERLDAHGVNEVLFPGRRAVAGDLLDLLDGRPKS